MKKTVYQYGNYRDFLRDFYIESKERDRKFTYAIFSKMAGFNSRSFFKLVIQGSRNLTSDSIEKICTALKFNKDESFFFHNLVLMNQATLEADKQTHAEQLIKSREYKKLHPLSEAQYNYFSQWYFIPVRELVALPGFNEDPKWISERINPKITENQAQKAIQELEALGLLKRDENGALALSEDNVTTPDEVVSVYLTQYHIEMIKKASEAISRFPREKREISSVTFAMSKQNTKKIKEIIHKCRKEILELTTGDRASNSVYQLNFQLFPLAELTSGENNSDE